MKRNLILDLFLTFAKIGLFTFGGGYAMIGLIEDTCVEKKGWITHEDMATMTAVAESTPGPIAINCATYTGYLQAGIAGSISATVGIVLPSFVIIYLISMFLDNFLEITVVAHAFQGIKIAVGILILQAGLNMYKKMKKTRQSVWIMGIACAAMLAIEVTAIRFSTIYLIVIAGCVSVAVWMMKQKQTGKEAGR